MVGVVSKVGQLYDCRVLVAGDFVLDSYTIGSAGRISPEAPVAVVRVQREEHRPGGAGNVVLNLLSLGARVRAVGRFGADAAGDFLRRSLADEGVDTVGLFTEQSFSTPVKTRIIAENQQIVRVDREELETLSAEAEQRLITSIPSLLEDVDLVAISDYGKGFFTPKLLASLIHAAREREIPLIVDPKGADFAKYRGAYMIKPNLSEAIIASGLSSKAPLEAVAERIFALTHAEVLVITRSRDGISLFFPNGQRLDFPTRVQEVRDVTGAGDTVLAAMACALGCGLSTADAAQLANCAASIAIERFGCARVSLADLSQRLLEGDSANKMIDEDHLFAAKHVLRGQKVVVVALDSTNHFPPRLFTWLRLLAQVPGQTVILYLRDSDADPDGVQMLLSLKEIRFVVQSSESLQHLCREIHPHEVYTVDSGAVRRLEQFSELVTL